MSYVGTPFYMCPEMKCHTKTDERGDTWALGCIIYELITNESFLVEYEN
jgi:serine/threonine protein kinase